MLKSIIYKRLRLKKAIIQFVSLALIRVLFDTIIKVNPAN
jgi:hypothetical protein